MENRENSQSATSRPNQRPRISDHESATKFRESATNFRESATNFCESATARESATTILGISDHMWESATANSDRMLGIHFLQAAAIYNQKFMEGSLETKPRRRSEMEKVRREKIQVREEVGKSRNTVFFQCFVAPEGRKVGSLKRRARSELAR